MKVAQNDSVVDSATWDNFGYLIEQPEIQSPVVDPMSKNILSFFLYEYLFYYYNQNFMLKSCITLSKSQANPVAISVA